MKNYTSSVPVETTISRIEKALAKAGARNTLKDYDESGEVTSLRFSLPVQSIGKTVMVQLPANIEAVERVLLSQRKRLQSETKKRIKAQAARTAWRIQQDWVEIQITLIELQQVDPLQVFLPYVWTGKQTYYSQLKDGGFKLLGPMTREQEEKS